jgi:ABC-type sugar transport system substrate-binding protein
MLVSGIALALASAGSATGMRAHAGAKNQLVVGYVGDLSLPVNAAAEQATIAEAKKLGVTLRIENVKDFTPASGALAFGQLVSRGVNIIEGNIGSAPASAVTAANKRHIPVVAWVNAPLGGKIVTLLHTPEVLGSKQLAAYVFKRMGGQGDVGYIQGDKTITAGYLREAGFRLALKQYPGINLAAYGLDTAWTAPPAQALTLQFFTAHPNIGAVLTDYDGITLGAIAAAKLANKTILTAGTDGECPALQSIWQGGMTVTLDENWSNIARLGLDTAVGVLDGKHYPKIVNTPYWLLDKALMTQIVNNTYKPPAGQKSSFPLLKQQVEQAVNNCQ